MLQVNTFATTVTECSACHLTGSRCTSGASSSVLYWTLWVKLSSNHAHVFACWNLHARIGPIGQAYLNTRGPHCKKGVSHCLATFFSSVIGGFAHWLWAAAQGASWVPILSWPYRQHGHASLRLRKCSPWWGSRSDGTTFTAPTLIWSLMKVRPCLRNALPVGCVNASLGPIGGQDSTLPEWSAQTQHTVYRRPCSVGCLLRTYVWQLRGRCPVCP